MKKLQNNFTTPEQSKRLLELGVPKDSADMYYCRVGNLSVVPTVRRENDMPIDIDVYCPCWSVGRLIEIAFICSDYIRMIEFWRIALPMDDILDEFENNKMDFSKLED